MLQYHNRLGARQLRAVRHKVPQDRIRVAGAFGLPSGGTRGRVSEVLLVREVCTTHTSTSTSTTTEPDHQGARALIDGSQRVAPASTFPNLLVAAHAEAYAPAAGGHLIALDLNECNYLKASTCPQSVGQDATLKAHVHSR